MVPTPNWMVWRVVEAPWRIAGAKAFGCFYTVLKWSRGLVS